MPTKTPGKAWPDFKAAAPKIKKPKRLPTLAFDTFQGADGGWFWRMGPKTGGRRTGDGSEGYRTRGAARNAIRRLVKQCRDHVLIDDVLF